MASPEQLSELTELMTPRVAALAARWCGHDAPDGAQEVHRELAKSWPAFRGDSAPTTWAHRIAIRTLARFAERRRRQTQREPIASQLDLSLDETALADFQSNPFTAMAANERRERVHAAIDMLSPALRDALVLRAIEGLDYRAIADTLELPLGTVKSRIAAATLRLAQYLQDLGANT